VLVDAGANNVVHVTSSGAVAQELERIVETLLRQDEDRGHWLARPT
jgi:hypothetical protein